MAMIDLESLVEDVAIVDRDEAAREEWLRKRAGRITCSRFGDLMGEGKAKGDVFTQTGYNYLRLLVAETLGSWYSISANATKWGTDNEPLAIEAYRARTGYEVDSRPFQYFHYNAWIGGTPDGLVGDDGCVEVKCPYDPSVHVKTLISRQVPKEYDWQTVGHLLVTGRKWCDFISYDPRMQSPQNLVVIRVERSEPRIELLKSRLMLAVTVLDEMFIAATKQSEGVGAS
jgi:hypothetical protein